jgi:hypothetical protein
LTTAATYSIAGTFGQKMKLGILGEKLLISQCFFGIPSLPFLSASRWNPANLVESSLDSPQQSPSSLQIDICSAHNPEKSEETPATLHT